MTLESLTPDATAESTATVLSSRSASRASRVRRRLIDRLYWMLRHVPSWLFSLMVDLLVGMARSVYWLPGNPLRKSASDICTLAVRAGHMHDPRSVYWRLTGQFGMVMKGFFAVYHGGVEANLHRVSIDPQGLATIRQCLEEHHGVILTVPHVPGGALSAFRLNHEVPTFVMTRQDPREAAKAAMQRDIFDHLGVEMLMARGATPRQVVRTCLEGARKGRAVVFTVDNLHPGRKGFVRGVIFGEPVKMGAWATRIAKHAGVPVLPAYVGEREGRFLIQIGEPLMVERPEEGVQHYLRYFEERILAEPGSWAYLLDRRWRRLLSAAASRITETETPSPRP